MRNVINVFIVLYLWMMLSTNLSSITTLAPSWERLRQLPAIDNLDRWVNSIGSHLAIRYGWRMFTPPEGHYYTLELAAQRSEGPAARLVLPHQRPRTWWQRNFVDAREEKWLVNLFYNDPIARKWYAEYWCRQQTPPPRATHLEITLHSFSPPAPTVLIPWGIFPCA
jgi:hypothetical protein